MVQVAEAEEDLAVAVVVTAEVAEEEASVVALEAAETMVRKASPHDALSEC